MATSKTVTTSIAPTDLQTVKDKALEGLSKSIDRLYKVINDPKTKWEQFREAVDHLLNISSFLDLAHPVVSIPSVISSTPYNFNPDVGVQPWTTPEPGHSTGDPIPDPATTISVTSTEFDDELVIQAPPVGPGPHRI